jgi:hypothetical protein
MKAADETERSRAYLDALAVGGTTRVDVAASGVTTDERDGADGGVVADEVDRVLHIVVC